MLKPTTNKPKWLNQVQKTLQTPNQAKANQTYSVMVGALVVHIIVLAPASYHLHVALRAFDPGEVTHLGRGGRCAAHDVNARPRVKKTLSAVASPSPSR
jgi:hypothetical protein